VLATIGGYVLNFLICGILYEMDVYLFIAKSLQKGRIGLSKNGGNILCKTVCLRFEGNFESIPKQFPDRNFHLEARDGHRCTRPANFSASNVSQQIAPPPSNRMAAAAVAKEVWGPPLWRLLHALTERLGRQTIPLLATDEKRAWMNLLKIIGQVMPCLACRAHFCRWAVQRPIERFLGSYAIRDDARRWLWALHDEVNSEKGVNGPSIDALPELYGHRTSQEINADYKLVVDSFHTAVQQQLILPDAFMTFKMRVVALRQLVG
jgi:hypothetical protein